MEQELASDLDHALTTTVMQSFLKSQVDYEEQSQNMVRDHLELRLRKQIDRHEGEYDPT